MIVRPRYLFSALRLPYYRTAVTFRNMSQIPVVQSKTEAPDIGGPNPNSKSSGA